MLACGLGHEAVWATSVAEAHKILEEGDIEVVLHDLEMPPSRGAYVTLGAWSKLVPIVVVSTKFPDPIREAELMGAGALFCAPKEVYTNSGGVGALIEQALLRAKEVFGA